MADASVRPATAADSPELARIQAAVWAEVHGAGPLDDLVDAIASEPAVQQWRDAATSPPSSRHRVLTAPAVDPDLDPAVDAELLELRVDPSATRAGHGSRLVNAVADLARDDGFHRL